MNCLTTKKSISTIFTVPTNGRQLGWYSKLLLKVCLVVVASLYFHTFNVQAANDATVLGVSSRSQIKQFALDGTLNDSSSLVGVYDYNNYPVYPAELDASSAGNEWVRYQSGFDGNLYIYNHQGDVVFTTSISTPYDDVSLAVGELDDNFAGPEIAVCRKSLVTSSRSPKVRIYSYDSNQTTLTKIDSVSVFTTSHDYQRGCSALIIADADADGHNDLFIINHDLDTLKVYTTTGTTLSTVKFTEQNWHAPLYVGDVTGDGVMDAVYRGLLLELDGSVEQIVPPADITDNIKEVAIADMIGDETAEYIYLAKNAKAHVYITDNVGTVLSDFNAYPNAGTRKPYVLSFGF